MRQINRIPDSPGNPYCTAITIDEMGRPVEMPRGRGRKKRSPEPEREDSEAGSCQRDGRGIWSFTGDPAHNYA